MLNMARLRFKLSRQQQLLSLEHLVLRGGVVPLALRGGELWLEALALWGDEAMRGGGASSSPGMRGAPSPSCELLSEGVRHREGLV